MAQSAFASIPRAVRAAAYWPLLTADNPMKSVSIGSPAMRPSAECDRGGESGFSLVEVMCAVAIMAFALVALYRGAGQSQRAAQYLETHLGARLVARSLIEDAR